MARPRKILSQEIKSRNSNISPATSKFILQSTIQISRKLASKWRRYADHNSLTQDIVTETLTAILTSNSFDPTKSEKQIYNYIKRTAATKTVSITRSLKKNFERYEELDYTVV